MSTTSAMTIGVTQEAALKRINRRLARSGEQMFKTRGHRGDWHIIDLKRSRVVYRQVELESAARSLKVLEPWETLSDD